MSRHETHEPEFPDNWPHGHVGVADEPDGADPAERLGPGDIGGERTDADEDECMVVRLGESDHFMHATTMKALERMVASRGNGAAAVTIHGITHTLDQEAVRALSERLGSLVVEWDGDPSMDPRA